MDDETYVLVDRNAISGKKFYNAVADKYRFKPREKYPQKYLVGKRSTRGATRRKHSFKKAP